MTEETRRQKMPFNIKKEDVDGENIKYIADTNELFAVSKTGAVYSFTYKMQGRIIGTRGAGGYITCSIQYVRENPAPWEEKTYRKTVYAHRLVAEAFIPNPLNKKQVCHIDGDRTNNCVDNLRWASAIETCNTDTHCENLMQSIKRYYASRNTSGRIPIRVAIFNISTKEIYTITPSILYAAYWIEDRTHKPYTSNSVQISAILAGKSGFKTCGGYGVRRAEEKEYQKWVTEHMNSEPEPESLRRKDDIIEELYEYDVDSENINMNKKNKDVGIKVINRRMNVKTGEIECDVREFNNGDKLFNDLY